MSNIDTRNRLFAGGAAATLLLALWISSGCDTTRLTGPAPPPAPAPAPAALTIKAVTPQEGLAG